MTESYTCRIECVFAMAEWNLVIDLSSTHLSLSCSGMKDHARWPRVILFLVIESLFRNTAVWIGMRPRCKMPTTDPGQGFDQGLNWCLEDYTRLLYTRRCISGSFHLQAGEYHPNHQSPRKGGSGLCPRHIGLRIKLRAKVSCSVCYQKAPKSLASGPIVLHAFVVESSLQLACRPQSLLILHITKSVWP